MCLTAANGKVEIPKRFFTSAYNTTFLAVNDSATARAAPLMPKSGTNIMLKIIFRIRIVETVPYANSFWLPVIASICTVEPVARLNV